MKNALIYYYNLNPNNIHQTKDMYKFNFDNNYYVLLEIQYEYKRIEEVYRLSNYLNENGIYNHQIILNIQKNIVTTINNKNYVLLKTYNDMNERITIDDIVNFSILTSNINYENIKTDWYTKWINKVDYFEYQIKELGEKYPYVKESFNYYSGLTETCIQLLVNMDLKKNKICICHERIKKNYTLFDFYNPFNFIIDINIRDIVEYLKDVYIKEDDYSLIEEYIYKGNSSVDELKLFFIRMLYPSFYYDECEKVIISRNEEGLIDIINKTNNYEKMLKKTYTLIRSICLIPEIEWLT